MMKEKSYYSVRNQCMQEDVRWCHAREGDTVLEEDEDGESTHFD